MKIHIDFNYPEKNNWGFCLIPTVGASYSDFDGLSILMAWLFWAIEIRAERER